MKKTIITCDRCDNNLDMDNEKKKRLVELRDSMKSYGYMDGVEELEDIFPEIKESEDEGIRKFIIDCIDELRRANAENADFNGCCSEAIAYLEKHTESTWTAEDESFVKHILPRILNPGKWTLDQRTADKKYLTEFIERQKRKFTKEQQPAEWSEEEKERIRQNGRLDVCYNPEKYGLCHKTEWGEGEMEVLDSIINDYEMVAKSFCGHEGKIMFLKALCDGEYGLSKQEWSEEDKVMLNNIIWSVHMKSIIKPLDEMDDRCRYKKYEDFLKALPERFNLQPKQESEPIEIKFAGKNYKVYGTKELPGGVIGYIIEDEPGHYDCIIHPDEVLGGGYGIKSNGSPYPTKEITFDEKFAEYIEDSAHLGSSVTTNGSEWSEEDEKMLTSFLHKVEVCDLLTNKENAWIVKRLKALRPQHHTVDIKDATNFGNLEYERGVKDGIQSEKSRQWKPSKKQMKALESSCSVLKTHDTWGEDEHLPILMSLINDLQKLL